MGAKAPGRGVVASGPQGHTMDIGQASPCGLCRCVLRLKSGGWVSCWDSDLQPGACLVESAGVGRMDVPFLYK